MRDDLDSGFVDELEKVVSTPVFLVELGFDTPVRLCTNTTRIVGNETWLAANMTVKLSKAGGTLRVFNEGFTVGGIVLQQGTAGRYVHVYQQYGEGYVSFFQGEMGESTVDENVTIQCKPYAPKKTPAAYVLPPVFNHIPKAGLRIETAKQIIILEGR